MAPVKGRGRPKKADAKTEETTAASPKSPAKSPKVAAAKSPAENGAKKAGRGRPAGKVTKSPKAKPVAKAASGRGRAKKEVPAAAETKSATPTKRKAEDAEPEAAPPAKSPKTENAKPTTGGRGRPKKDAGATAAKKPAKSPAAKKTGRGRKPAAEIVLPETNGSPININVNVAKRSNKKASREVSVESVELPAKSRKRVEKVYKEIEEDSPVPVKKSSKTVPKGKKAKSEPKPKLNKAHTNFEALNFDLPSDKEFNFKISSINVAGLRAFVDKGGLDFIHYEKPDILCLQETKCMDDQIPDVARNIKGYHPYWLCKPGGHAGIAIYSKVMPLNVEYGLGDPEQDSDGRILTAEYEKFYLVCTYVPNAGRKLVTLDKRLRWNKLFETHVKNLDAKKPVIIAGDMNVAHTEIDLTNPKTNKRNAGFTQEERDGMTNLLKLGFVDTFRHFYPDKKEMYTFWSYMGNARAKNVGWRLDYFLTSQRLIGKIVDNVIRDQVMGSDHCPITLFMKL